MRFLLSTDLHVFVTLYIVLKVLLIFFGYETCLRQNGYHFTMAKSSVIKHNDIYKIADDFIQFITNFGAN